MIAGVRFRNWQEGKLCWLWEGSRAKWILVDTWRFAFAQIAS
jgi:hypothetical protein